LKRLQEIQRKRDATNRDWQRIILRNIGKSLGLLGGDSSSSGSSSTTTTSTTIVNGGRPVDVIETRQLWWQIHQKMQSPDYGNMLLLIRMLNC
jgi:hypothetical protein